MTLWLLGRRWGRGIRRLPLGLVLRLHTYSVAHAC